MQSRTHATLLVACLLALPGVAAAQSDVTFTVPVKLTQLAAELTQIQVDCSIDSPGVLSIRAGTKDGSNSSTATGYVNLPVTAGQVVATATVVVPIPADAISGGTGKTTGRITTIAGKPATYRCHLTGYSNRTRAWAVFSDKSSNLAFQLTPAPADITGSFTW